MAIQMTKQQPFKTIHCTGPVLADLDQQCPHHQDCNMQLSFSHFSAVANVSEELLLHRDIGQHQQTCLDS